MVRQITVRPRRPLALHTWMRRQQFSSRSTGALNLTATRPVFAVETSTDRLLGCRTARRHPNGRGPRPRLAQFCPNGTCRRDNYELNVRLTRAALRANHSVKAVGNDKQYDYDDPFVVAGAGHFHSHFVIACRCISVTRTRVGGAALDCNFRGTVSIPWCTIAAILQKLDLFPELKLMEEHPGASHARHHLLVTSHIP